MGVQISSDKMNVDVYEIFSKIPNIRVNIKQEFVSNLRYLLRKRYSSFMECARKNNFTLIENCCYTPLKTWLKENKKYRTAIPFTELLKLCEQLNIAKEQIYENILSFQVWTGKKYKPYRFLSIDEDLAYGLGLYLAEGKNHDSRKHRTGISNSEEHILHFVVDWYKKYFNLNIEDLKFYINTKDQNLEYVKRHIVDKFFCSSNQIKCYSRYQDVYIVVDIVHDCKSLRLLVEWLKTSLLPIFYKHEDLGKAFVQGVFDGEGHVRKDSAEIIVEMKDVFVLDFCELILRQIGIRPNRGKNKQVLIIETRDFPKLKENMQPFRFHEERKYTFEKVFKQIEFIQSPRNQSMLYALKYLYNKGSSTLNNTIFDMGYKEKNNSVSKAYRKAEKLGYVNINGKGSRYDPLKISITEEGKKHVQEFYLQEIYKMKLLKENVNKVINFGSPA